MSSSELKFSMDTFILRHPVDIFWLSALKLSEISQSAHVKAGLFHVGQIQCFSQHNVSRSALFDATQKLHHSLKYRECVF